MDELDGQVCIVTGGGRGIGRAIAEALARDGAAVCVAARSADEVAETAKTIAAAGGRVLGLPTDVRDKLPCTGSSPKRKGNSGPSRCW